MKSYHANSGGGLQSLTLREHDVPKPGAREVLIRVRANSLNARELSVLRGQYPLPIKKDVIMASDGAGEVVELGEGVARAKVGDRVAVSMFPRWFDGPFSFQVAAQIGGSLDGMLTEYQRRTRSRQPSERKSAVASRVVSTTRAIQRSLEGS
jgi:NADPH:quinone reductase-like Zn-dependent oxidoreductase